MGFFSKQRDMALIRAKGFVIGEIIKKSVVPFIPNSWCLTILQAIPSNYIYAGSRSLLLFTTVLGSRISSYNFYNWIPFLPHSSSTSTTSVVKVEEVVDSGIVENAINVITSLPAPVTTGEVALRSETLNTTTQSPVSEVVPSLVDIVLAPLQEQIDAEVQTALIQNIGNNVEKLEHVVNNAGTLGSSVGVLIFLGVAVVVIAGLSIYRRYFYNSQINKLVKDQNLLIDKYNEN